MVFDFDKYKIKAEERYWDHSIPWNCPSYHDGCNCKEVLAKFAIDALDGKALSPGYKGMVERIAKTCIAQSERIKSEQCEATDDD